MENLEKRINELKSVLELQGKDINKLFKEIKDLKQELEKERAENKNLQESKYNSNNHLIYDNNRYAKTYEDKYIEVMNRLKEIERMIEEKS